MGLFDEVAKGFGEVAEAFGEAANSLIRGSRFEAGKQTGPEIDKMKRDKWMVKRRKYASDNPSVFGQAMNNGFIPFGGTGNKGSGF